ncbi:MAG: hypothetical protein KatS3mg025_0753 [Bacteroidia bacterium]|jgi:hypothetical protein|nr:MAG: hypothetical protein KatS3mg025_0753 [Bacteroidia bacterium]
MAEPPLHIQQLQVCAWRIKYLVALPTPLESQEWQRLQGAWPGSRLDIIPVGEGLLYKLTLPERLGTITGSTASAELYAVLARQEARQLLTQLQEVLHHL